MRVNAAKYRTEYSACFKYLDALECFFRPLLSLNGELPSSIFKFLYTDLYIEVADEKRTLYVKFHVHKEKPRR